MNPQVSYDIFCTQRHTIATSSVHTAVLSVLDGREVGLVCRPLVLAIQNQHFTDVCY